ncbi:gas vesicle protein GvpO, halophile-type [Natronosalvus vescus]|uniref:gas vesicle protein GvpO, halophile-type n=1 Tax=Natronosalvus vescus TaxID=2953881 RepID=UPI00273A6547|nr:gas vesicle protein GvpO [Natronosalvus vescus]
MAEAQSQATDQCKALTASGERCSRPAKEDGFCHQHDSSDETIGEDPDDDAIDEAENDSGDDSSESSTDDSAGADADRRDEPAATDTTETPMQQEEVTEPQAVDVDDVDLEAAEIEDDDLEGLLAIRKRIERAADSIIGHPLDTISEISPTEEGWIAVVDVIERRAVPDTQDIIGRYELTLEEDGAIRGYQRLDRYRRGDTTAFE